MKPCFVLLALSATAIAAPLLERETDSDGCEMRWLTVYTNSSATSTIISSSASVSPSKLATSDVGAGANGQEKAAIAASPSAASSSPASGSSSAPVSASTSGGASTTNSTASTGDDGRLTSNSAGQPGFPVNGQHLSAPTPTVPVPAGAATYTPPSITSFSGKAFNTWLDQQKEAKLASKWLVVAPGIYDYNIDDIIAIGFTPGGWTLDLRGVTFLINVPNPDPTSGQAIYINQSEDFTILGGTIWFDSGEQWSQALVTSLTPTTDPAYSTATFTVEAGYNVSVWSTVDARNQGCVDTSDANHYTRPDCNFFYVDDYDFSGLNGGSGAKFTARVSSRAGLKEGYHITTIAGPNSPTTIASEFNGGLHVNGLTSNGGLAQYGLSGKTTATFENVWNVNPPPRAGLAPRVQGPTLSQGHIGLFDFNAGGQVPIVYKNSFWQTTGCGKDLQDMGDQDLH